jgi:hypothetical protein
LFSTTGSRTTPEVPICFVWNQTGPVLNLIFFSSKEPEPEGSILFGTGTILEEAEEEEEEEEGNFWS